MSNPFEVGDGVWYDDFLYIVEEVRGDKCFINEHSSRNRSPLILEVHYSKLERVEDDDDESFFEGQWLD